MPIIRPLWRPWDSSVYGKCPPIWWTRLDAPLVDGAFAYGPTPDGPWTTPTFYPLPDEYDDPGDVWAAWIVRLFTAARGVFWAPVQATDVYCRLPDDADPNDFDWQVS